MAGSTEDDKHDRQKIGTLRSKDNKKKGRQVAVVLTIRVLEGKCADLPFLSMTLGPSWQSAIIFTTLIFGPGRLARSLLLGPPILTVVGPSLRVVGLVDLQQVVVLVLVLALVDL